MPSPGKSQLSLGTVKCWEPAWFKNESQLVSTCYVINVWEVKVRLSPGIYTCAVVASCYQMESSFQLSSQCLQNGLFCKPMTYRCLLSTECPVYSPVTVPSEFRSRFNVSLALLLLYPCITSWVNGQRKCVLNNQTSKANKSRASLPWSETCYCLSFFHQSCDANPYLYMSPMWQSRRDFNSMYALSMTV